MNVGTFSPLRDFVRVPFDPIKTAVPHTNGTSASTTRKHGRRTNL